MTEEEEVRAAGAVVLRTGADGPEVLVVHRPNYDDWSLPKGKVDPGEDFEEAAVRELEEETGVRGRLIAELSSNTYPISRGRTKRVRWWSMTAEEIHEREPDGEVDLVEWWPIARARTKLSYEHDRQLLTEAQQDSGARIVMLVRHADAGDRSAWTGEDFKRPLSETGIAEAEAITSLLSPWHVSTIVSSPAKRCRKTVKSLSRARNIKRVNESAVAEGASIKQTMALLDDLPTGAVVCSHGDVIGNVLMSLSATEPLAESQLSWPKASTWVLTFSGDELTAARFLPRPVV